MIFYYYKMAENGDENTPLLENDTPGEPPPNYNDGNNILWILNIILYP